MNLDPDKAIFSVREVADLCHVSPRTVHRWFDTGRLEGYRIPGSCVPRIPRKHLIAFLERGGEMGELTPNERAKYDEQIKRHHEAAARLVTLVGDLRLLEEFSKPATAEFLRRIHTTLNEAIGEISR